MAEFHTIKALLYDNLLTENPDDFTARVQSEKSLGIADVCKTAVSRGGADISAKAMEHAVRLFLAEMAYRLQDGFSVNTGYFNVAPRIIGVFNSQSERFDRAKHRLSFDFKQGGLIRKGLENIEVQITGVAKQGNIIARFYDVASETENEFVTNGGQFVIEGAKIKIAGDDPECGLYFVSQTDTSKTAKLSARQLAVNNPSKLVGAFHPNFEVSDGEEWKVLVKTQFGNSAAKLLNEPRTVEFSKILVSA
jgi:hypothetical protein